MRTSISLFKTRGKSSVTINFRVPNVKLVVTYTINYKTIATQTSLTLSRQMLPFVEPPNPIDNGSSHLFVQAKPVFKIRTKKYREEFELKTEISLSETSKERGKSGKICEANEKIRVELKKENQTKKSRYFR